jgi:ParB family chromosome partitioning protein
MKRNVLGKGIAAIISNEPISEKKLFDIAIDNIYPNPFQPRKNFQEDALRQLAESMKEIGIIQPLVVFKREGKYFIVVGERRWRAAQLLKWEKIPALVKEFSDDDIMAEALIENIQREELNAMEIAEGIEALISQSGEGQQEIADKLGMKRTTVTNFLRLLKLPAKIKEYIANDRMDQGHARALLSLKNDADILEAAERVIKKKYSVRQTETLVKNYYVLSEKITPDPDILKMENKLTLRLASKVKLAYAKAGNGKIEIYFHSLAEFERLFSILIKEK